MIDIWGSLVLPQGSGCVEDAVIDGSNILQGFPDDGFGQARTLAAVGGHTQLLAHFAVRTGALQHSIADGFVRDAFADTNVHKNTRTRTGQCCHQFNLNDNRCQLH